MRELEDDAPAWSDPWAFLGSRYLHAMLSWSVWDFVAAEAWATWFGGGEPNKPARFMAVGAWAVVRREGARP